MPGYVIHLTEAKIICDILEKSSYKKNREMYKKREYFYYGSLLPDAGGKAQKQRSHFWNKEENGKIIMTPDIDEYLRKYAEILKSNPLYKGYLAHLHLDQEFWKRYIKENVEFRNAVGGTTEYIKDLKDIRIKKNDRVVSAQKFFSEDYLYGDYTKLNKMMIQKYRLSLPVYNKSYSNKIEDADNEKMKEVLEQLGVYIINSRSCAENSELKVLDLCTFETFLKETAYEFVDLYDGYIRG